MSNTKESLEPTLQLVRGDQVLHETQLPAITVYRNSLAKMLSVDSVIVHEGTVQVHANYIHDY